MCRGLALALNMSAAGSAVPDPRASSLATAPCSAASASAAFSGTMRTRGFPFTRTQASGMHSMLMTAHQRSLISFAGSGASNLLPVLIRSEFINR